MDREQVDGWMQGYVRAWTSNDPAEIGALFTEDGLYFTGPFEEPWRGREGIVAGWLEIQNEPGTWEFEYEILAVEGNTAVVRGHTQYLNESRPEYSNIWLMLFDDQGRCREFTEWWMKRKQ